MAEGPGKSHRRLSIAASLKPRALIEDAPAQAGAWTARVLTLYPEMFPGPLGGSLIGKALHAGLWRLETTQIRDFGIGRHRAVDDTPAGGGAGMVLRADVLDRALRAVHSGRPPDQWPILALSPRGRPLTQALARGFAAKPGLTLLCGRFEGIDQRVLDAHAVTEVSLGDFVLTGGEIAAMALIDATVRLIPQVLGNAASIEEESFSSGLLEYPHYTKPTDWEGRQVPEVLLSGHHGQIAAWRRAQAEAVTQQRRPDLWRAYLARQGRDPAGDAERSGRGDHRREGERKDD